MKKWTCGLVLCYNLGEEDEKGFEMFFLRRFFVLILAVFIFTTTNAFSETAKTPDKKPTKPVIKTINKEIEVQTKDGRIIKATLSYQKNDAKQKYPTVVLLHSLGYSSDNWGDLIPKLINAGYAVIAIDFRGHGKSVYDTSFKLKSWAYFNDKIYQKFPSDVIAVLNQAQKDSKKISMDNMAIVGADIGANTAVLASKDLKKKPKTLVLISVSTSFKGLYLPITLAEIGKVPILSIASQQDRYSIAEQKNLAKFAQGGYYAQNYPTGGMGMMMLTTNPTMSKDIVDWIKRFLK